MTHLAGRRTDQCSPTITHRSMCSMPLHTITRMQGITTHMLHHLNPCHTCEPGHHRLHTCHGRMCRLGMLATDTGWPSHQPSRHRLPPRAHQGCRDHP